MKFAYSTILLILLSIILNSQTVNYYYDRGVEKLKFKEYKSAIEEFKKVVKKDPYYWEAWYDMGIAHLSIEYYNEAITDFTGAIKAKKNFADAYIKRAQTYLKLDKKEEAINDFDKIIKLKPKYISAYEQRGVMYFNMKEYKKSENDFLKAIELGSKDSEIYFSMAEIKIKEEEDDKALKYLNSGLELDSNKSDPYLKRAKILFNKKKYSEAISDASKAIDKGEKSENIFRIRANSHFFLKNYESAIKDYTVLIEDKRLRRDRLLLLRRGISYNRIEKYKDAARDLSKAIAYDRKNFNAYYERAVAYSHQGKSKEVLALRDFEAAMDLNSKCHEAYFFRGKYYLEHHLYEKAIEDFSQAIKVNENPGAEIYYLRGAAYSATKQRDAACMDLKKASELGHKEAEKLYNSRCFQY